MKIEIDVSNLENLAARLGKAGQLDFARDLKKSAARIIFTTSEYPPMPPHGADRWYERGFGPRWARVDGGIGGRATSERLKDRWYSRIAEKGIRIGNRASYAEFVHGKRQNRIHTRNGWLRLEAVTRDELDDLEKDLLRRITKQITGGH